jgi:hypothetical protein
VISDNQFYSDMDDDALDRLAAELHIDLIGATGRQKLEAVFNWAEDEERFLDVLHYTLQLPTQKEKPTEHLEALLASGRSVWRVTPDGLERRVDPTAMQAFNAATATQGSASEELADAWSHAYGRNPDASDAWDHAIKADEAVLINVVVPNQTKPTLGHVVQHLRTQGHLWKLLIPGPNADYSVAPLVAMLDLMWPNPDRHGNPQVRRTPTIEEARAVVQLAVAIVHWARDGQIVKR